MLIKQLSVFIENREGRLEEVTKILAENKVNIVTLSLADTSEYGVLRMIVSDPTEGKRVLKEAGFSVTTTEVIAAVLVDQVQDKAGTLHKLLKTAIEGGSNVEYVYIMPTGTDAAIVIKVSDPQAVARHIEQVGFRVLSADEAYRVDV